MQVIGKRGRRWGYFGVVVGLILGGFAIFLLWIDGTSSLTPAVFFFLACGGFFLMAILDFIKPVGIIFFDGKNILIKPVKTITATGNLFELTFYVIPLVSLKNVNYKPADKSLKRFSAASFWVRHSAPHLVLLPEDFSRLLFLR